MKEFVWRGLIAAVAALALPSLASAEVTLHVGKAALAAAPTLAADVGVKAGIFAKHGLDVQVSDFSGGGKMHQAMAAGSIDIGVGAGPEMALVAKGSPELAICNTFPPATFIAIMVPADGAKSIADLKGKRIAVSSAGGLTYWLALELARTQGWGPDGVKIVTIGNGAASIVAAFQTHAVDADIGPSAVAVNMEVKGTGRLLLPVSKYEGNLGAGMIFATNKLIASHPDTVRRFLAAWFDTVKFMRTHKDETVKIESAVTGFSPEVQAKEYDLNIGGFSNTGKFDKESLTNLSRSFVDLKLLDTPPDMSKLYTEKFLPKS
jgi:NitT/TauT family transport system substrate-binding protein